MMNSSEYSRKLVSRIRPVFESNIIPLNIVYVFQKYDSDVLVSRDVQAVRARCNSHGNIDAANLLLDLLVVYDNWFDCLLKVLRDQEVKLKHVAKTLLEIKDTLDQESSKKAVVQEEKTKQEAMQTSLKMHRNPVNPSFHPLFPDGPMEINEPSTDCPLPTSSRSFFDNSPLEGASNDNTYIEPVDYESRQQNRNSNLSENIGRDPKKVKFTSDIPGREFDEAEANVLNSLPGWHASIQSRQVLGLLKPHTRVDGCYIIWYWKDIKRPAICVTHENDIKTLIIHKRPAEADDAQKPAFYFINKNEKKCGNLKELVDYHIRNGVFDLSKKPYKVKIFFNQCL